MATSANERSLSSIRTLWGIAKSAELSLEEADLYAVVFRETGKEHMRDLTQGEIENLARILQNMRYSATHDAPSTQKRTDEGGNSRTINLRHKIFALTGVLGWNHDNRRINAFVLRVTGVERIEWLSITQCNKVIEALKDMVARTENNTQ